MQHKLKKKNYVFFTHPRNPAMRLSTSGWSRRYLSLPILVLTCRKLKFYLERISKNTPNKEKCRENIYCARALFCCVVDKYLHFSARKCQPQTKEQHLWSHQAKAFGCTKFTVKVCNVPGWISCRGCTLSL